MSSVFIYLSVHLFISIQYEPRINLERVGNEVKKQWTTYVNGWLESWFGPNVHSTELLVIKSWCNDWARDYPTLNYTRQKRSLCYSCPEIALTYLSYFITSLVVCFRLFNQTTGHVSKNERTLSWVHLQTVIWLLPRCVTFQPMSRTCFTLDNDTLSPASASIFMRCFAFVLEFKCTSHQSIFISGTENLSPLLSSMVAGHSHGGYSLCLNRWIWHLQASGNHAQGWPRLVEILFDFPMMSHKEVVCLRCALKYIHRCGTINSIHSHVVS